MEWEVCFHYFLASIARGLRPFFARLGRLLCPTASACLLGLYPTHPTARSSRGLQAFSIAAMRSGSGGWGLRPFFSCKPYFFSIAAIRSDSGGWGLRPFFRDWADSSFTLHPRVCWVFTRRTLPRAHRAGFKPSQSLRCAQAAADGVFDPFSRANLTSSQWQRCAQTAADGCTPAPRGPWRAQGWRSSPWPASSVRQPALRRSLP